MKSVHEGIKDHKCELCDKYFSEKGNLDKHMKTVHEGIKDHKCKICDKSFSEKASLNKHMKSVHEESKIINVNSVGNLFS